MAYDVQILADTWWDWGQKDRGARITTFLVTFPRFILAEVNTHRMLSRNFESSRAVPVAKRIARVEDDPFIPLVFGRNRGGMQATDVLSEAEGMRAREAWLDASRDAVASARRLAELGVHKQLANRVLEPYSWVSGVITATEWDNFFALRCHPDAQPEFRHLAEGMRSLMRGSTPIEAREHLPFVPADLRTHPERWYISAGRCARVSYATHDGAIDPDADIALGRRLRESGHMSPFEHAAEAAWGSEQWYGNFRGWVQFRKVLPGEAVFKSAVSTE